VGRHRAVAGDRSVMEKRMPLLYKNTLGQKKGEQKGAGRVIASLTCPYPPGRTAGLAASRTSPQVDANVSASY